MVPNYLAVVVSAIVMMALGFLWYSPILFGKKWSELKGYTDKSLKDAQKKMGGKYFLSFLGSLVSAYVLGWITMATNATSLTAGMGTGLLMWLGFVTTTQLSNWIFSSSKKELYFIDTGYQLVSFVAMGAILGAWR